jgi:hypothetical protein
VRVDRLSNVTRCFGIFNGKLQLVAVAHLAALPGGLHMRRMKRIRRSPMVTAMEFGVSVLALRAAGKGLGHAPVSTMPSSTHAIGTPPHLMIHALSENAPMLRIAAKSGAVIEQDGPEAEAWLKLPPDTVGTHVDSSLHSLAAEVIYRVKYRVMHISDWLRMLMAAS